MAYTKTNWVTGDVVTSEKLNKIEQGIVDAGPMIVHATKISDSSTVTITLDKTFIELKTAFESGRDVKLIYTDSLDGMTGTDCGNMVSCAYGEQEGEFMGWVFFTESTSSSWAASPFVASSESDYPIQEREK